MIICPICQTYDNEPKVIIQIEGKTDYKGRKRVFNIFDEYIVNIMAISIVNCIDAIMLRYEKELYVDKVYNAIKFSSELSNISDFKQLLKSSIALIDEFLECEKAQILFFDYDNK